MKKIILLLLLPISIFAQKVAKTYIKAYPDHFIGSDEGFLIWRDSSRMLLDDRQIKSFQDLLTKPDLQDQVSQKYFKKTGKPLKNQDAGRMRYEPFFRKMYGNSPEEVRKTLTEIVWLPNCIGKKLLVTKINGINQKFEAISRDLEQLLIEKPHYKRFLEDPAGTFNWRTIAGTNRLSTHSFGMTIDLNTKHSHYWQWDCKCQNENQKLGYRNEIPAEIVRIFEKYGFIWGGKWYHYDTMHFEYRPELLD